MLEEIATSVVDDDLRHDAFDPRASSSIASFSGMFESNRID